MTFATWKDGFALEQDSRRLDPIYYYVKDGDLVAAVPFEVEPLYEDERAPSPVITVAESARQRVAAMPRSDQLKMYVRVVSTLAKRYKAWQTVTLKIDGVDAQEIETQLTPVMQQLAFVLQSASPSELVWARP